MKPYYDDGQAQFYLGDVRESLRALEAGSVNMCVTSPPYWGLRDYGTATWDGGDAECEHKPPTRARTERPREGLTCGTATIDAAEAVYRDICGKCGARRIDSQLGLEATPEAYITAMVDVFREVRRVLADDGTCWINIGDSYAGSGKGPEGNLNAGEQFRHLDGTTKPYRTASVKPKDLVGIPWMLAFALRADGWYLRQDIIWSKPNPMPESVTDRCTKAHEYLFLLSKRERYYYDADAIREAAEYGYRDQPSGAARPWGNLERRAGDRTVGGSHPETGRNKRSVWTIATAPFPEAHFATFPPDLVRPCILAGTSEAGYCVECGKPWERVVERDATTGRTAVNGQGNGELAAGLRFGDSHSRHAGWAPTCTHDAPKRPGVVLDPFLGSGTTAMVAKSLGRRAVGIDLNAEYLEMAKRRCAQMALLAD